MRLYSGRDLFMMKIFLLAIIYLSQIFEEKEMIKRENVKILYFRYF